MTDSNGSAADTDQNQGGTPPDSGVEESTVTSDASSGTESPSAPNPRWWTVLVRGLAALLVGGTLLLNEFVGEGRLASRYFLLSGLYILLDSTLMLISGVDIRDRGIDKWWLIVGGCLGFGPGLFLVGLGVSGEGTFRTFLQALLAWAILTGATEVLAARRNWETPWRKLLYSGATSLLLGVVLASFVISEVADPRIIASVIGFYLVGVGVFYGAMATGLYSGTESTGSSNRIAEEIEDVIFQYEKDLDEYKNRISNLTASSGAEKEIREAGNKIDLAREILDEARKMNGSGRPMSAVRYFYKANEQKIYILYNTSKIFKVSTSDGDYGSEYDPIVDRIIDTGEHVYRKEWADEQKKDKNRSFLRENPSNANNLWRRIYTRRLSQLDSVLTFMAVLRTLFVVLSLALVCFVVAVYTDLGPFRPQYYYLVPLFGIIGAAVNNARTWSAQTATLELKNLDAASIQPAITLPLVRVRLLVGAVVAIFVVLLFTGGIIAQPESTNERALFIAAAFVAGFADELVVKGVEKLVEKMMGSEETPKPVTETAGAEGGGGSPNPGGPKPATETATDNGSDGDTETANTDVDGENREPEDADGEAESQESGTSDAEGTEQDPSGDGKSGAERTNRGDEGTR